MQPTYIFDDFVADCAKGHPKAIVISKAIKTAPADFNLHTSAKVLEFIGNGGLERPHFINSKIWKNNPEPKIKIMVDAYDFYSGRSNGYIAFFKSKFGIWNIKSFKKNSQPNIRNDSLEKLAQLFVLN